MGPAGPGTAWRRVSVAIVTGGSSGAGLAAAHLLASRGHAIVIVYLEDQRQAELAVDEIFGAPGLAGAVRADVTDELDVERLYAETIAEYGHVDLVVHTTTDDAAVLSRRLPEGASFVTAPLV
jgi:NAD(P)-dependent dehydrogenase (short-subunit alcohol dehydrogenase family)